MLVGPSGAIAVFDGLAAGPEFGTYEASSDDNGDYIPIDLSEGGLDYLNDLLGLFDSSGGTADKFAFGGKLVSIGGSLDDEVDDPYEEVFAKTHPNGEGTPDTSGTPPYLELVFTPEPATLVLLAIGACLPLLRKRK
ncbi:hypothetical protein LCGC14_2230160 [marine sediment metagenome]|uniref:Uncharacterized protein n=1 Tax=marine sediment metagenome TaxID=412755 RepID=A0A0F9G3P9_9ZZZZ